MSLQKWPLEKLIMKKKGGNSNPENLGNTIKVMHGVGPWQNMRETRGKKEKKNWPYKRVCIPLGLNIEVGLI